MSVSLGRYGVWRHETGLSPDLAVEIEKLGFGAVWVGGSPPGDLALTESLLDATTSLAVATGIVNIWATPADEVAESFHRIEARHPGRFLLGIGVGHPEATSDYTRPYAALVAYVNRLDEPGVPTEGRALAALGPKMLDLARERSAGTHPYLTTPEHTRSTRERYGAGALIAPEHKVVLDDDPAAALGRVGHSPGVGLLIGRVRRLDDEVPQHRSQDDVHLDVGEGRPDAASGSSAERDVGERGRTATDESVRVEPVRLGELRGAVG